MGCKVPQNGDYSRSMKSANGGVSNVDWPSVTAELLDAALGGNRRVAETIGMRVLRQCRVAEPQSAQLIGQVLSSRHSAGTASTRSAFNQPLDSDTSLGLLRITQSDANHLEPILPPGASAEIDRFLEERAKSSMLFAAGLKPPSTILLLGPPGTGKTMLAGWVASRLGVQLATFDLATAISSFLGKTGLNLRRALDYARENPTVLLLDEFDSIAKRRGDSADIGELSRIVNTLLKELEDWPTHSVIVAATNHEALLDPAIFRRFDAVIRVPLPEANQRRAIFERALGQFAPDGGMPIFDVIVAMTQGANAASMERLAFDILRDHVLTREKLENCILKSIPKLIPISLTTKERAELVCSIKQSAGKSITYHKLSEWFGIAESTIHHHVKNQSKKPTKNVR